MTTIRVEKEAEGRFAVFVREGRSQSRHVVSLTAEYLQKLTGGKVVAEELIRCSFEFLLEQEPKESILHQFDLPVISRYFPEYEREIRRRLGT